MLSPAKVSSEIAGGRLRPYLSIFRRNTHYEVLGVDEKATKSDIRKAYQEKIKNSHPDHNDKASTELFQKIRSAFRVLSDPRAKKDYDVKIKRIRLRTSPIKRTPRTSEELSKSFGVRQDSSQSSAASTENLRRAYRTRMPRNENERLKQMDARTQPVHSIGNVVFIAVPIIGTIIVFSNLISML